MLESRHLFKHYRRQKASRGKRWQMPPSLARRCTWVLVFIRKSSPKLLNGFILFAGKGIKLHFVSFMLQFVFVCLVWDSAPSLGSWWHKPGPSPSVVLGAVGLGSEGLWEQIARQCGELVPHYCVIPLYLPGLGTATLAYPSLLTCAGSLSRDWSLCQRSCSHKGSWVGGTHTRRKGLTFRGKLSRFVYRATSFLRLMKGRWAKKQWQ